METQTIALIAFLVGLLTGGVVGALGTIAAFGSKIAVVGDRTDRNTSEVSSLRGKIDDVREDINRLAATIREAKGTA